MADRGAGDSREDEGEGASGGAPAGDGRRGSSCGSAISTEQILQTGSVLLRGFIADRVQRSEVPDTTGVPELGAAEQLQVNPSTKRLCECLRKIGDELDGNMELQSLLLRLVCEARLHGPQLHRLSNFSEHEERLAPLVIAVVLGVGMIEQVHGNPPKEVFLQVATEMFADGNFNWGRVVALFYFACKLVLKALWSRVPQMIRTIIDWTIEYLRDHVVQWIRDQGGWEGLLSYFGTPTWQTVGVFLAGVLTATVAIWRYS